MDLIVIERLSGTEASPSGFSATIRRIAGEYRRHEEYRETVALFSQLRVRPAPGDGGRDMLIAMPQRYGLEINSAAVGHSPADPVPTRRAPTTEREATVLLAEWFERGYDEVEAGMCTFAGAKPSLISVHSMRLSGCGADGCWFTRCWR